MINVLDIIKSVIRLLTIMPKSTGTVTTKNILTAIDIIEISLVIPTPRKLAELNTIKGTIKIANKLTTAVKLTDNATSPFANLVKTLEVTPPGAAAIIITPIAISIGIGIIKISPKAITGSKITCDKIPTKKSLGVFSTLLKSLVVNPRPKPNIIMARHTGAIFVAISIGILKGLNDFKLRILHQIKQSCTKI